MNKKRFLLAIIFVAIFFCLLAGKIIAQSPLLLNDHLTPTNPKEGEQVNFSIRIRLNTKDGCGHSYESAPAPPYNSMLVDFGDGHISPGRMMIKKNDLVTCQNGSNQSQRWN